ncbi:hypothetical protein CO046_04410 [Candidatus Peregrinibacteria bacterium CG_4_9_14_0_2_um_filter_53_11]|nr:MAG: hypothetical protein CO046_04410 [Candidatus Peregrinibacteria bacterium CG_4_9_14_0_2_um_filter_53_11]
MLDDYNFEDLAEGGLRVENSYWRPLETPLKRASPPDVPAAPTLPEAVEAVVCEAVESVFGKRVKVLDKEPVYRDLRAILSGREDELVSRLNRNPDEVRAEVRRLAIAAFREHHVASGDREGRPTYSPEELDDLTSRLYAGQEQAKTAPESLMVRFQEMMADSEYSWLRMKIDKPAEDLLLTNYCIDLILASPDLTDEHRIAFVYSLIRKKTDEDVEGRLATVAHHRKVKPTEKTPRQLVDETLALLKKTESSHLAAYAKQADFSKEPRQPATPGRMDKLTGDPTRLVEAEIERHDPKAAPKEAKVLKDVRRTLLSVALQHGSISARNSLITELNRFILLSVSKLYWNKLPADRSRETRRKDILDMASGALARVLEKLCLFDPQKSGIITYVRPWILAYIDQYELPAHRDVLPIKKGKFQEFLFYTLTHPDESPKAIVARFSMNLQPDSEGSKMYTPQLVEEIRNGKLQPNRGSRSRYRR